MYYSNCNIIYNWIYRNFTVYCIYYSIDSEINHIRNKKTQLSGNNGAILAERKQLES